jgi:tetratricopeptide (TPR) repeat protein
LVSENAPPGATAASFPVTRVSTRDTALAARCSRCRRRRLRTATASPNSPRSSTIGDSYFEGKCWGNLGDVYRQRGAPADAVGFCERAIAICRDLHDDAGEATGLIHLGLCYRDLGRLSESVVTQETAVAIWRRNHNWFDEAEAQYKLSETYLELRNWQGAVESCERAISLTGRLGDHDRIDYFRDRFRDLHRERKLL